MKEIIISKENIIISDGKSWFKRGYVVELKISESITKVILIFSYLDNWLDKFEIVEFLKSAQGKPELYIASTYLIEKANFLNELDV